MCSLPSVIVRALAFVLGFAAFVSVAPAQTASWRADAWNVTIPYIGSGYNAQIRVYNSSGVQIGSSDPNQSMSGNTPLSAPSLTMGADFFRVAGRALGTFGAFTPLFWQSAYKVGDANEVQSSGTGPYAGSNPVDGNGNPINPTTGGTGPVQSYSKTITLQNPGVYTAYFEVTVTYANPAGVVADRRAFAIPGKTNRDVTLTYSFQFNYAVRLMQQATGTGANMNSGTPGAPAGFFPTGSPVLSGSGDAAASGLPTSTNGDSLFGTVSGASGGAGGMSSAGGVQSTTPDLTAVANQTRPGTTEGNADARNTELRNEIQRSTTQTKNSGDQVSQAIKDGTSTLGDKLDQIAENTKSSGSGSGKVSSDAFDGDGNVGDNPGSNNKDLGDFASNAMSRINGIRDALANLLTAAGLNSAAVGSAQLSWTINVMGSERTVSVEQFADYFATVRSAFLWICGVFFVWSVVGIARGLMVEEGAR